MRKLTKFATALLFGLLLAWAPNGGRAIAQPMPDEYSYFMQFYGLPLLALLFSEPPAATEERELRETAANYSEARVALSEGTPSAKVRFEDAHRSLEGLADPKFTRSPRVRKLARNYLSRLPKRFVSGHAYTRGDQTAAADPDPRIRSTLKRGRYTEDAGDGADGGDD